MTPENSLNFGNASWLYLLVFLLPLAWLFYYAHAQRKILLAKMTAPRLRGGLMAHISYWKRNSRSILILVALGLLIVALAGPRFGYTEKKITSYGRDVILAIDTSRSMLAVDVAPTRLDRAKLLAQDIIELLPGDRLGLIAFAGSAFLQAPMTLDHHAVSASLTELDTHLIPKGGTNISEAIRTAITAFGKEEGTNRALIIITDGEDLEEDALTAAQEAAAAGVKVFTIGIGSESGSLIPIKNEQGGNDFVRNEEGKPVLSKLDIARLKEIAQKTGGFYEPFGPNVARVIVDKGILSLQAGAAGDVTARRPIERYEWPVGAALLLLLCWIMMTERRQRGWFSRRALNSIFFLTSFSALILFAASGNAAPGMSYYEKGDYEAALQDFENRLKSGNAPAEVKFDAGAAAYKKGDYKKAAEYFTSAMTDSSPKLQQAATYNLANTLVRQGEAASDASEKLSDWKNALQHYDTVIKGTAQNKEAKENRELVEKLIEDFKKQQEQQKKNPPQNKNQQQKNQDSSSKDQQQKEQQQNQQDKKDSKDQKKDQDQSSSGNGSGKPDDSNASDPSKNPKPDQKSQDSKQQNSSSPTPTPSAPSSNDGSSSPHSTPTPSPDSQSQKNQSSSAPPTPSPESSPSPQNEGSASANAPRSSQEKSSQGARPSPTLSPGEKKSGDLSGGQQGQNSADQEAASAAAAEEGTNGMMSAKQAEALLRSMQGEEEQVKIQQRQQDQETTKDW